MNHEYYMQRALKLAAKGHTSPNPMVGAVVVKDGEIVGEGYHPQAGKPHAEVYALHDAGEMSRGATVYVTLEPCCHFGRTPPCTDALLKAGVSEVYVGMLDPDDRVSGNGVQILRESGIKVHQLPSVEESCKKLNEAYIKHRTTGLPFVTLKSAMSLDGRIATSEGDSKWITGETARRYAHRFRAKVDAIIVGAQTVRKDNPSLTARVGKHTSYPVRVVVSHSGNLDLASNIFNLPGEVIVAVGSSCNKACLTELDRAGVRILQLESDGNKISARDLLVKLGNLNLLAVLIEGGGELAASFLKEELVDRAMFYHAPKIIGGGSSVASIGDIGTKKVAEAPHLTDIKRRILGDDLLVEGRIIYK